MEEQKDISILGRPETSHDDKRFSHARKSKEQTTKFSKKEGLSGAMKKTTLEKREGDTL